MVVSHTFFTGLFIVGLYLPEPKQDTFYNVGGIGFFISIIGLGFAIFPRLKKIGPDGKVYYYTRAGFYVYTHPSGKVELWPGDGKGDGDKKE